MEQVGKVNSSKIKIKLVVILFSILVSAPCISQTYSFTPAGATGRFGPTQAQVNTAYALTNLNGSVTSNNGIQSFTLPTTGLYRIEARGAKGGAGTVPLGGFGAKMQGDFYLTAGQVIKVLVGQLGSNGTVGGGGGASFVTDNSNNSYLIAGGGGGGAYLNMYNAGGANSAATLVLAGQNGQNGSFSITAGLGGLSGSGGATVISVNYTTTVGSGGGGLTGNGQNGNPSFGGLAYTNGGDGGAGTTNSVGIGGNGGFGGGGGGDWAGETGAGGGGGYSGGGGGVHFGGGGGGGSYNSGANQVNASGSNSLTGLVVITKLLSGVAISQTSPLGCNGFSNAALSATPVGGSPPYTYSWSPGGSTLSAISGLGAGTYTCKVTDALSVTLTSTFTINAPGPLLASIASQSNVTCFGGSNGQAQVGITGGTFPFSYTWSPTGGNGAIGQNLSAGNYTCNIVDVNGCSTSVTTAITQATTVLSPFAGVPYPVVCLGGFAVLIGNGAVTYSWTGGVTNGVFFYPTVTTTYTLTGYDAAGCSGTAVATITVNPLPSVVISTINPICLGSSATLIASGANTYTWSNATNNPTLSVTPTVTTSYTVTGTGANACQNSAIRTVTVVTTPTVVANASSFTVCQGAQVTLFGSGAASYVWSSGVINNVAFSPTATASYTVTGTNACGSASSAITVTVLPLPSLTTSVVNPVVCVGNTVALSANGANTYTWSAGISNGVAFSPSVSGNYTVQGTNACGTASAVTSITVNPLPTISVSATSTLVCLGGTTALQATGALTYTWTGGVTNNIPFSPTLTSNYTVTATDANGCNNSASKTVSVSSSPVLSVTISNPVVCFGNPVTLNGSGANSYTWSGGVTNNITFVPLTSNIYTLSGSNFCGTSTAIASITVNPLPTLSINVSNPSVCMGGTCVLQAIGATSYFWTGGINNNVAFSPTVTNTYNVIGTDANGCQNNAAITITVNPLPTLTVTASNTLVCIGTTVVLNASGASTYSWSGGINNNVAFTPTVGATYTVTGIDANGCQNTAIKAISVLAVPVITANATNPAICLGSTVSLFGAGAASYTWSGGISNNVAFTPTATGAYTVSGSNFCGSGSATITVTVNSLPNVFAIASSPSICMGNTVTVIAGGALSYTWSNGIFNNVAFTPTTSATYTVTGTNINGCQNTATQQVAVNALPTVSANASSSAVCIGSTLTLTGSGANTYTWTNGVTNGLAFTPTTTLTYSVTGTNTLTGCTSTNAAFKTITVNVLPVVSANSSASVVCAGNSVTLNGSGANTYIWNNSVINGVAFQPTNTATYLVSGTNTLTGCSSTNIASIIVSVNPLPVVTSTASNLVICSGGTIALTAGGANTYTWTGNVFNGLAFSPTITSSYSVTGTNTLTGCSSTNNAMQTITVNSLPQVSVLASNTAVCLGNTLSLTGTNANTFTWSGGITNAVPFNPTLTTTYTVNGTNTLTGCSNTATQLITVNPLPTITALANNTAVCAGNTVALIASGANIYLWSNGIINTIPFTPTVTTNYSVTGTNTLTGCSNTVVQTIIVHLLPSLTVNSTSSVVCLGNSITLTASGANTYSWTNGIINGVPYAPSASGVYTVAGTNSLTGCANTLTYQVTVNPLPVIIATASQTQICVGGTVSLTGVGANTYTWNNGVINGIPFTPLATASYSVIGTNTLTGCTSTNLATQNITVNPLPVVSIISSNSLSCIGDSISLTANGATSYTWSNGSNAGLIGITPTATSVYSVTGKDVNSCLNTSIFTQAVSECTSISKIDATDAEVIVYPNPSDGDFYISANYKVTLTIMNEIGQVVKTIELDTDNPTIKVNNLANGIYLLVGSFRNSYLKQKIVVARY